MDKGQRNRGQRQPRLRSGLRALVRLGPNLEASGVIVGRQPQSNLWAVQLDEPDETVWANPQDIEIPEDE